jgi:23S rRNA pseudouridine1911/1915/1917 synthase
MYLMNAERILFEDNHLIAVNKYCSDIVQGDKTGDRTLADAVKDFIKERDRKPGNVFLGVCHRLDRPTSGVVVFAKTGKALSRMNAHFRESRVAKTYWAVTGNEPPERSGTLIHHLSRNQAKNKSTALPEASRGSKRAELAYLVTASSDRYFLLEITPTTGRHHQIRAQLAAIGCPVKGDLKYGSPRSNPGGGIHLHARKVSFEHPTKKELIEIVAPVPDERLWQVLSLSSH